MKIALLADQHGFLPPVPEADLLLIAGDICPVSNHDLEFQRTWLDTNFRYWLRRQLAEQRVKKIVACAGNHDLVFQEKPHWVPSDLPWTYLQDRSTEFEGLNIYGTPWQPTFGFGWAFNADEPELAEIWEKMPLDTDIVVVHGPPLGYGDFSPYDKVHTGSPSLLRKIEQIEPKLVVSGHIHDCAGIYNIGKTIFVNASHVNEQYLPVNPIRVIEI